MMEVIYSVETANIKQFSVLIFFFIDSRSYIIF